MRRPRSRITIRRLMLLVATVALLLGAVQWGRQMLGGGLFGPAESLPYFMAHDPDRAWWTPGRAGPFEVGEAEWPSVIQTILIEHPDDRRVTIDVVTEKF